MREPPPHVSDDDVLATVREHWAPDATRAQHLPVGFGAHHWAVSDDGAHRLFVTVDALEPRHSAASLEATYAATAALADLLDFVVAPLPTHEGRRTAALGTAALSVTPWTEGVSGPGALRDRAEAEGTAAMLSRLHAVAAPAGTQEWRPLVSNRYAAELALALGRPWDTGPYGERARGVLAERIGDIGRWVTDYHRLASVARTRPWVPTHGEPHTANQLVTPTGRLLGRLGDAAPGAGRAGPAGARAGRPRRPLRAGLGDGRDVRPGVAARRDRGVRALVRRSAHRHRQRRGRLGRPPRRARARRVATPGLSRVSAVTGPEPALED